VRYWLNKKVAEVQDGREDAIHIGTQKQAFLQSKFSFCPIVFSPPALIQNRRRYDFTPERRGG